jgi:hypothetical protein
MLMRQPGFTLAAALTLALGIGVNTAFFTMFHLFDRPLPLKRPGEDPLGKNILRVRKTPAQVVGVAKDAKNLFGEVHPLLRLTRNLKLIQNENRPWVRIALGICRAAGLSSTGAARYED